MSAAAYIDAGGRRYLCSHSGCVNPEFLVQLPPTREALWNSGPLTKRKADGEVCQAYDFGARDIDSYAQRVKRLELERPYHIWFGDWYDSDEVMLEGYSGLDGYHGWVFPKKCCLIAVRNTVLLES
jgi:hypothetical protein